MEGFIGIQVSKATLDLASLPDAESWTVTNDDAGLAGTWRRAPEGVFYVAKFPEAVYVLHAFEKRTRQTRQADLDLARARLAAVIRARRSS